MLRRRSPTGRLALLLVPLLAAPAAGAGAGELRLTVEGLRSGEGVLAVCLFRESAGFPDCAASPSAVRQVVPAAEGATLRFSDLAPGTYAVSVLHDENGDGQLGTNVLGIPTEGVAVSGDRFPAFSAPRHADAAFALPERGGALTVRMRYW